MGHVTTDCNNDMRQGNAHTIRDKQVNRSQSVQFDPIKTAYTRSIRCFFPIPQYMQIYQ
jgi:hypothetical protein